MRFSENKTKHLIKMATEIVGENERYEYRSRGIMLLIFVDYI